MGVDLEICGFLILVGILLTTCIDMFVFRILCIFSILKKTSLKLRLNLPFFRYINLELSVYFWNYSLTKKLA